MWIATVFLTIISFSSIILPTLSESVPKNFTYDIGKNLQNEIKKIILSPKSGISFQCIADLIKLNNGLRNKKDPWPYQMLDSWGKIPVGISSGNIYDFGQFDECLDIKGPNIKGKYCKINFPINITGIIDAISSSETRVNFEEENKNVGKHRRNLTKPKGDLAPEFAFKMGICIPHKCSVDLIKKVLPKVFDSLNVSIDFTIEEKYCVTDEPQIWTTLDYVAISIFAFFAIIILLSTGYDLATKSKSKQEINRYHKLLVSFSMWTNTIKLISTNKNSKSFKCINGLRSLSILWIIFGHRLHIFSSLPLANINYIWKVSHKYSGSIIFAGRFSTDTFFVLSGCLIGYTAMKKFSKDKNINIIKFYVQRIIRLTPAFAAVILIYASLFKFLGNGPMWSEIAEQITSTCKKDWWSELLYIQNYIDPVIMCMNHSWYLCADMQLYILSPLLIYPLLRWKKFGLYNMILWILISQIITFAIAFHYKFIAAVFSLNGIGKRLELFELKTHTRATPWLMGFSLGYFLYLKSDKDLKIPKWLVAMFWLISLVIFGTCCLTMKSLMDEHHVMSYMEDTMFLAFAKTGWSAAVIWIIIACIFGYGGPINWFLSLRIWEVFGKLTYCMYLLHLLTMLTISGVSRNPIFLTDSNIISTHISDVFVAFIAAYFLAIMFEIPFTNLISFI